MSYVTRVLYCSSLKCERRYDKGHFKLKNDCFALLAVPAMSVPKDVSSLKFLLDLPSVCFLGKQRTPLLLDNLGSFRESQD